jgi:hypothetical protein
MLVLRQEAIELRNGLKSKVDVNGSDFGFTRSISGTIFRQMPFPDVVGVFHSLPIYAEPTYLLKLKSTIASQESLRTDLCQGNPDVSVFVSFAVACFPTLEMVGRSHD